MNILRFFTFFALVCFSAFSPAFASDDAHLQSAFMFAKKKMWADAVVHAKAADSDVLVKYFIWEYLKDPEADATFTEISSFLDANPGWPDRELLEKRAEAALLAENPSDEVLDKWYSVHPPKTALGKKRKVKSKEELHEMIREAWVNDDYTKAGELRMLANYRSVLRPEDHARRANRLLWEGKEEEARRLLVHVSPAKRSLFEARIALMRDTSNAPKLVSHVPAALRGDAGLLYDRIRYRGRRADKDGVRELLLISPQKVPYPEKWWGIRERYIREALGEGKLAVAERLLARHGQREDSVQYKEVQWLRGWIDLEFRKKPKAAYDVFEKLYDDVETPGSKSRAAYWAGRAAEALSQDAGGWYRDAAKFNTTFYGQLALTELSDSPVLAINADDSEAGSDDKRAFNKRELVRLVQELARAKQSNLAGKFILFMVENAKSTKEAVLAAQLGRDINRIDIGVRASKKALRDGVVTLASGYPVIRLSDVSGLEKSFVLALMRQESEFFADAVSTSGALGLMQLLPSTAKEIARKEGMGFTPERLFEPSYNATLGSKYLSNMVERFGGSYVLATASYNAGPGRVRQWVNAYGAPGKTVRDMVNWVEGIPFSETRNYVQHVMGNMQVYRYVLSGKRSVPLMLAQDLERGVQ